MGPLPAEPGELIGAYRLLSVLSRGGMGCVYKAEHTRIGRVAAVKVLASHLVGNEAFISRFLSEARIANAVRHQNIVDIYDFVETEAPRRVACVMEYIEGPTLKAVLAQRRLTTRQAMNVLLQVSGALEAVHALNVIHRDLKPTNLIITGSLAGDLSESPSVKILDFGIAKVDEELGDHKTISGTVLGTPAYMAPEQASSNAVSPATDLYAFGGILYEMVTQARVFTGTRAAIVRAKRTGDVPHLPFPLGIRAEPEIRSLVLGCLRHDPAARPSLTAIRASLLDILEHKSEDEGIDLLGVPTRPEVTARTPEERPLPRPASGPPAVSAMAAETVPLFVSPLRRSEREVAAAALSIPKRRSSGAPVLAPDDRPRPPEGQAPDDTTSSSRPVTPPLAPLKSRHPALLTAVLLGGILGAVSFAVIAGLGGSATTRNGEPTTATPSLSEAHHGARASQPDAQRNEAPPSETARMEPLRAGTNGDPAPTRATVRVESNPPGAIIVEEGTGAALGRTPGDVQIPFGKDRRIAELRLEGHAPLRVELVPEHPRISVVLAPARAPTRRDRRGGRSDRDPKSALPDKTLPEW